MKYSVLVVEDDAAVAKGLIYGLEEERFVVYHADTGEKALAMIRSNAPHVILLDLRLPDIGGLDVCRRLRSEHRTMPVIIVTAKDEEVDRILGLEIGADDYVVKPYSVRELVSRIRAQIRRCYGTYRAFEGTLRIADITIDQTKVEVYKRDSPINLTPIEYKLLIGLATNADVPLSREYLIEEAWGLDVYLEDERTVDVHIRHLREKIEDDPAHPEMIQTVRGFGYRFRGVKKS